MKKLAICLWQRKFFLFIIACVGAVVGLISVYSFYNPNHETYSITFKTEETLTNPNDLVDSDYILNVKNEIEEIRENGKYTKEDGTVKYPYSSFDYVNVSKLSKSSYIKSNSDDSYTLFCQIRYFNSWQQARRFMKRMIDNSCSNPEYLAGFEYVTVDSSTNVVESIVTINEGLNMYVFATIGLFSGLVLGMAFISIIYFIKRENLIDRLEYDNENIYKYPIRLSYWKNSLKCFKDVKSITMMSILLAMMQVCKLIPIPSGFSNLGLSLGFLFFATASLLYGPVAGLLIGFMSDIFGFFVFPDGFPFHFGYTLNAMLSGFIYGLCFYKTKVTFSKCFFARLLVNIVINGILGSIWWGQTASLSSDATRTYMFFQSMPKNVVYLIPQSVLLFLVFKTLSRVFRQTGLVDERICNEMTLF